MIRYLVNVYDCIVPSNTICMQIIHFRPIYTIFDKFYIERSSISNWRSPMKFGYTSLCNMYNGQPRWLSGLRRSRVHSLWLLVDHCVLRNWDRILVRAVKGLISRAGMVSICPLLWQRDVKLQQTNKQYVQWTAKERSYHFCNSGSIAPQWHIYG